MVDLWGILPYVILAVAVGLIVWKFGGKLFVNGFKGKQEVQRIVYEEANEKIKLLGVKVPSKYLYYGLVQLGKVVAFSKTPYTTVKWVKEEDAKTLLTTKRKDLTNAFMYYIKATHGFLGLWNRIFLIKEEHLTSNSNGYIIDTHADLEKWGSNFWFSKDPKAQLEVENIVWKDHAQDLLGLVKEFPEKIIKFEPQTAHDVTKIKEEYAGQQRLKQGRQTSYG